MKALVNTADPRCDKLIFLQEELKGEQDFDTSTLVKALLCLMESYISSLGKVALVLSMHWIRLLYQGHLELVVKDGV